MLAKSEGSENMINKDKTNKSKCCWICKWSEPIAPESEHDVSKKRPRVSCTWLIHNNIPISIHESITFMCADEGSCCSCFERRDDHVPNFNRRQQPKTGS